MGNPNPVHKFTSTNQPKKNGRKKGSRNIADVIREVFETEIDIEDVKGKPKKVTVLHAGIVAMCKKMNIGDVQAFKALCERIEGMPKQESHVTIDERRDLTELSNEELDAIIKDDKG